MPAFKRTVTTKQKADTLADVLRSIREHDYSQYPVYDEKTYVGLLTENGITRWLAEHVATQLELVDLSEVSIGTVLRQEEARRMNCQFAGRNSTVAEIRSKFAEHELLEAVLITEKGRPAEKLLGIATRWDLLRVHDA
jgi:predicted transcriptional regulator